MNMQAAALAEAHLPDEQTSAFARDAIDDLSQRPKRLSPKYFYDATGSELFEAITRLPEYYPTRTELSILRDRGREIAATIPKGAALIEFGAGATTKVRLLLNECAFRAYVPVDISGDFLKAQADALAQGFPGARHLSGRRGFHRAVRPARSRRRDAEGRVFSGLDARQFRAARGLRLPAQRPRHSGQGRANDHRRRPGKGRTRAVRRL